MKHTLIALAIASALAAIAHAADPVEYWVQVGTRTDHKEVRRDMAVRASTSTTGVLIRSTGTVESHELRADRVYSAGVLLSTGTGGGSGDMVQSVHGVAIAESTAALASSKLNKTGDTQSGWFYYPYRTGLYTMGYVMTEENIFIKNYMISGLGNEFENNLWHFDYAGNLVQDYTGFGAGIQADNITANKFYGDGSGLTGLPGGGDMVNATHGAAIAAATTTLAGLIPTAHQQLTSTGTLTHAALESTLTAVNEATATLKSISDAHAATLVQVGVDTATLAGLVGSGAGDNLGNHVATTTLNMGFNNISNPSVITSTADITIQTQFNYAYPFGGIKLRGNSYGISYRGIDIDNEGIVTMGPTVFGNTIDFNYRIGFSSRGFIGDRLPFRMNQGDADTILLVRDGGYGFFAGSVTASSFYGDVSGCTGFPAATVPASISVDTITVGGTPALNGYPVSVNGDVLVSSGVLYLRNSQLLMAHPDGETSVYLLSTDSDSYNADILMQSGSTLTVTGSGNTKSHYVQNGNITADYIYGNGSQLTGLATGGYMVQATHGVAIGASTATLRTDVTALQQSTGTILSMFIGVGASTATLRTDVSAAQSALTNVGASTATLRTDVTNLQTSTGTIKTQITAIGTSTATLRSDITTLWTATGTLKAQIAAVAVSTRAFTTVGASTATLRTDVTALAVSTGMFTTVATATGTLRTDVNALKASTGAVSYTSQFITYGSTQTFITYIATQVVCGLQTSGFTISSATARVNGGTSATIRLFITAKNSEYSITAATPIWNTGVVAGTAHTGGTLSNVSVTADQCITAVIDGISGAVSDILVWVRGNR